MALLTIPRSGLEMPMRAARLSSWNGDAGLCARHKLARLCYANCNEVTRGSTNRLSAASRTTSIDDEADRVDQICAMRTILRRSLTRACATWADDMPRQGDFNHAQPGGMPLQDAVTCAERCATMVQVINTLQLPLSADSNHALITPQRRTSQRTSVS